MRLLAVSGRPGLSCLLLAILAFPVQAQQPDSVPIIRTGSDGELQALPLDDLDDFLVLLPGVTRDGAARLVIRGFGGAPVTVFEGVPVQPAYRGGAAGIPGGWGGSQLRFGHEGLGGVTLTTGLAGVLTPGASGGILVPEAPVVGDRLAARGTWESDEWRGLDASQGFNVLRGSIGGRFWGRLELSAAGTLTGARSQAPVPGGTAVPIYSAVGIDTTVLVPGPPTGLFETVDSTFVPVTQFAIDRGDCGDTRGSTNPGIADNYGYACGIRLPASASSTWQLQARARYALGSRSGITLAGAASQDQRRAFDYENLYNPLQLAAARGWSGVMLLAADFGLEHTPLGPMVLGGWVSRQGDEGESGPLTTTSEADSRDPSLGFMPGALDFRFGLDDFPVNAQLIDNIRRNTPGSRRAPADLDNPGQYAAYDLYRNNAYGLLGFSDGGGPTGRLALYDESRTVVGAQVVARPGRHRLTLRLDHADADIAQYAYAITSQQRGDVWLASPTASGIAGEARLDFGDFLVDAGARYDRFASGAVRPWLRDTVAASPTFGEFVPFPRVSSYGYDGTDWDPSLIEFREDASHAAFSPSLRVHHRISTTLAVRAGASRLARTPDASVVNAGVNTDIALVNGMFAWGSDLDPEYLGMIEGGLTWRRGGWVLDGTMAYSQLTDQVVLRLANRYDPLLRRSVEFAEYANSTLGRSAFVLEAQAQREFGRWVTGRAAYTWTDASEEYRAGETTAPDGTRPHVLSIAATGAVPEGWQAGSLVGSVLSGVQMSGILRTGSGAPYTRCAATVANAPVLSGQPCLDFNTGAPNDARLPSFSLVDLRLEKAFALGSHTIAGYVDVRNLFDSEVVNRLFAATGTTSNELNEELAWRGDSLDYRREAVASGVLHVGTGAIDLQFGGMGANGCGNWRTASNQPAAPNCVYLIRAEERFGDGDGIFTLAEQQLASSAHYRAGYGRQEFLAAGRRIRLGLRVDL